jgi:hypothetical protein
LPDYSRHIAGRHRELDVKHLREPMRNVSHSGLSITAFPNITRRTVELVDQSCLAIKHDRLPVNQTREDIRASFRARGTCWQRRIGRLVPGDGGSAVRRGWHRDDPRSRGISSMCQKADCALHSTGTQGKCRSAARRGLTVPTRPRGMKMGNGTPRRPLADAAARTGGAGSQAAPGTVVLASGLTRGNLGPAPAVAGPRGSGHRGRTLLRIQAPGYLRDVTCRWE